MELGKFINSRRCQWLFHGASAVGMLSPDDGVTELFARLRRAKLFLERLRDMAYTGAFQRLYVLAPDRLARRYVYSVVLIEELQQAGVEVVFLHQTASTTPKEELLRQVQGMIAEYERAKILERTRRGKRHAASLAT